MPCRRRFVSQISVAVRQWARFWICILGSYNSCRANRGFSADTQASPRKGCIQPLPLMALLDKRSMLNFNHFVNLVIFSDEIRYFPNKHSFLPVNAATQINTSPKSVNFKASRLKNTSWTLFNNAFTFHKSELKVQNWQFFIRRYRQTILILDCFLARLFLWCRHFEI